MWDTRYFAERGYGCKWCFQKSQILCIEDHVGTIGETPKSIVSGGLPF